MSLLNIPLFYRSSKIHPKIIPICLQTLPYILTLNGSKYPCLEQNSMVSNMFEPLKFDCIYSRKLHRTNVKKLSEKKNRMLEIIGKKKIIYKAHLNKVIRKDYGGRLFNDKDKQLIN